MQQIVLCTSRLVLISVLKLKKKLFFFCEIKFQICAKNQLRGLQPAHSLFKHVDILLKQRKILLFM